MKYDLLIRNGIVIDGTGTPGRQADVGINGSRIEFIGATKERGRREIDAEGHVVTPGFIDGHTHMDAQIFWDSLGSCSCWHGVTTVVMGNCGFTLAPARAEERSFVVRNLERAEDISAAALAEGIEWTWESFPEYMDALEKLPKAINYATSVGHSSLRTWAMGERAFTEEADLEDLKAMDAALHDALAAGALGFTTSRTHNHETSDNRPVASRIAHWDEIRHLARELGKGGGRLFEIALEEAAYSLDPQVRQEPYNRLRDLALECKVPITFGIVPVKSVGSAMLELIDSTNASGALMFGMSHSRGVSITLSFKVNLPFDQLPDWHSIRSLPLEAQRAALEDPETRRRLIAAAHAGPYGNAVAGEPRKPDYDMIQVMERPLPPHKSVALMARERNVDPVELMIDLALASDFDQMFIQPLRKYEDAELLTVMRHPDTVMTFSDSGAHVSQILDSSIQTHFLAYWVRERQAFSLEQGVQMLTQVPATRFGLPERGILRKGYAADINIFEPGSVGPLLPWVERDLPGGGKRLKQKASGFLATVVGGEITLQGSESTGATSGSLLRRRQ
jgi:N-acyl-D-amino-acid deacylase